MSQPTLEPPLSPTPPKFSLAAILGYLTAVCVLLALIRLGADEFCPPVIRLPANAAALMLFAILVQMLGIQASSLFDWIFSGPKSPDCGIDSVDREE